MSDFARQEYAEDLASSELAEGFHDETGFPFNKHPQGNPKPGSPKHRHLSIVPPIVRKFDLPGMWEESDLSGGQTDCDWDAVEGRTYGRDAERA